MADLVPVTTLDVRHGAREPAPAGQNHTAATAWDHIGLAVLLIGTAVMYLWNITINGMGNQFYAGAAQAGSKNWEALLFGSLDPHNFITVDKPPVSQWVMGLSGQIFGFSSASMLVPQALMAVAAVALTYGAVAGSAARGTAFLAGATLALTPGGGVDVSVQQSRRSDGAADDGGRVLHGACAGKSQRRGGWRWPGSRSVSHSWPRCSRACMVLPALGLAYLIAAPTPLRQRLLHLLGASGGVAGLGWLVRAADPDMAGVVPALHRWLHGQQFHEPGPGQKRIRPSARQEPQRRPPTVVGAQGPGRMHGRRPLDSVSGLAWRLFSGEFGFRDRLVGARGSAGDASLCSRAPPGARARTSCGPAPLCSAAGWSSTGWC